MATWNLWWRFGDWRRRRDAIDTVLAGERPDVCGLQEVWADGDDNLAGALAARLGRHWTWCPSPAPGRWQDRIGAPGVDIGNAVLSRWPILDRSVLRLPAGDDPDEGRTALYALIDVPGGPLPFFTTQLNSAPHQSALRCAQVRALAAFVAERSAPHPMPPVVTGDFNATPGADEIRLLGGHQTAPPVPGQVLVDAWLYTDGQDPGWTWDRANPHVRASLEPSGRIDYVLVGAPRPGCAAVVLGARLFGDRPVDGVWPSDHAGVRADLARVPGAG